MSWFNYYFMVRTYSNSLETVFNALAFLYWQWDDSKIVDPKQLKKSLTWAALACLIRPTSALIWVFLGAQFLYKYPAYRWLILRYVLLIGYASL
jgi:phosphatidylinositol glycan class B